MVIDSIIVDDEPNAAGLLHMLLKKNFSDIIRVCAICTSVTEALPAIEKYDPRLVFLDVEMPGGTGFSLLETLDSNIRFDVIFTTAHSHYAKDAFRVAALDFLLKPIEPEILKQAVQRAASRIRQRQKESLNEMLVKEIRRMNEVPKIGLPMMEGVTFVEVLSIVRCEASGNYTTLFFQDGKSLLVCRTLKDMERMLEPYPVFFRIHKSHIINLNKVSAYSRGENPLVKLDNGAELPVSRQTKAQFEKAMDLA
jgi:two-component system, LytTR family, response regulator